MPDTPKRPVPRGRAIRWTDADLDAMTSPEALMAAQDEIAQAWRRDAPPEARGLIDAGADDAAATDDGDERPA